MINFPTTESEQRAIGRVRRVVSWASAISLTVAVGIFFWIPQWLVDLVEGYVPLINLGTEG